MVCFLRAGHISISDVGYRYQMSDIYIGRRISILDVGYNFGRRISISNVGYLYQMSDIDIGRRI